MKWSWFWLGVGLTSAAILWSVVLFGPMPKPPHCYQVIDRNEQIHYSEAAPYYADFGYYYSTDDEWGVVLAPAVVKVDKNCLREKGVIVDGD